jgi:hypothetical protein
MRKDGNNDDTTEAEVWAMKAITMYEAEDGSRFTDAGEAAKRDGILEAVAAVMAPLGVVPEHDGCDFENGHGYYQHDPGTIRSVRLALYELSKEKLRWWTDGQIENHGMTHERLALEVHPSWHLRMLDGSCRPLEKAWTRIYRIDSQGREWGQPYFADNTPSGDKLFRRDDLQAIGL